MYGGVRMYMKYLTESERKKIEEIEKKIAFARTIKEVELYRQQIGLIMERIIIRKNME